MGRVNQLTNRINQRVQALARPIARDGLKGLRAGVANVLQPARANARESHGYGSGMYSGAYAAMAAAYTELRGDPTGLALLAETSEVINNCLAVRRNAIAGLKWSIYPKRGKRDSNSRVENTAFHRMHDYAYTEFGHNFFDMWELGLSVHGEVMFEKLKYMGLPGGLKYLNRLALTPFVAGGQLQHYQYSDQGMTKNFMPDEIIRHGYANLLDDFSGSAPVSRALEVGNIDRGMKKHVRAYFRNGAKIGGWLTLRAGATLSPDEFERLKKEFKEHLAGSDNAYKWGFLPAEIEASSSENQPFDHYTELEDSDIERMHWAMRVSPVLTGAIPASDPLSSLGTLEAAKAFFYESFVSPEATAIAQVVNTVILPWLWMDEYEFVFEVDSILATMQQTKDKSDKAQAEFKAMGLSYNEYRQQLGYDPDPAMDDMFWYEGVGLVPKVELPNIWKTKLLVAPSVYNSELITSKPLPQPVDPNQVVPDNAGGAPVADPNAIAAANAAEPTPPPPVVGKSVTLALTLPNHPDLISLQNNVKEHLGDVPCKWNAPDSYHVTLIHAPAATDAQIKAVMDGLDAIELPELNLRVGSLNAFEGVGQYPVHFRIRQNGDLRSLQQQLYDVCKAAGIAMSSFSQPLLYVPHITMGYTSSKPKSVTFRSKLAVAPKALEVWSDGGEVLTSKSFEDDEPDDDPPAGKATFANGSQPPQSDALDELRAWRKKVDSARAAGKALASVKFQNYLIRDVIADGIRSALGEAADKDDVDALFERARELVSYKAVQATRIDFELEVEDLLAAARNDEKTRQQFRSKLASLLSKFGKLAFLDGLTDGGIDEPVLSDEDKDTVATMLAEQSQYVSGLADVLFKGDGISDAEAAQRPAMWWNKSINPFYQAGLASADKDGLYEWVYGDTEHCADCVKLNGQRHRMKDYIKRGWLPQADALACHGFNCKCKLVKVAGRARGNWLEAA